MTLRSAEFDDVYFSSEDGLAEAKHVFLNGNDLPAAWSGRESFTIAETGFGTGRNFLAAWTLFAQTAHPGQRLHYVAVERYPLTTAQIHGALRHWEAAFEGRLGRLLAAWPLSVPGFHRLDFGQVTLTLIFDDVMDALPQVVAPAGIDAWFLDGFSPKKNPQMWTPEVFAQMARLSHAETTYATFTAKGIVRRALAEAGFTAERRDGYGNKWHMTRGRFAAGASRPSAAPPPAGVAIIGGGLAGTAASFMLRRAGIAATIFEAGDWLAAAASGNPLGLVNPRLAARRTAHSDYHAAGFALATRLLADMPDVDWRPCGSLHLAVSDDRSRQLQGAAAHWGWPEAHLQFLGPSAAADIAGFAAGDMVPAAGLWLPAAGTVSPAKLCRALAGEGMARLGITATPVARDGGWQIGTEHFAALLIAGGAAGRSLLPVLPLRPVRGQLTRIETLPPLSRLRCALYYGGYLAPAEDGRHWLGATFQRGLDDTEPLPADDAENIAKLRAVLPGLAAPAGGGGARRYPGGRAGSFSAGRTDHGGAVAALCFRRPWLARHRLIAGGGAVSCRSAGRRDAIVAASD